MLVGAGLGVTGCAAQPPSLPGGAATFGGSTGAANPVGMGVSDEDDGADAGEDEGGGPPDWNGESSSGGVPPGGIDENTSGPGDESGGTGGSSDGSTGGDSSSSGGEVWFAGHYEGTWDGDCSSPLPVSGNGSWSVDVDDDGNIDGSYSGNVAGQGVSGTIAGTVDDDGMTVATATGPTLGECDWDGVVHDDGDAHGDLDCSLGCSGDWSGSKS